MEETMTYMVAQAVAPGVGVHAVVEQAREQAHVAVYCGRAQRPRGVREAQIRARALQQLDGGAVAPGDGVLQRRVAPPVRSRTRSGDVKLH